MKFLVDMNLSPGWVEALVKHGITAVHWSSVGQKTATDHEIMAYAAAHDFIVLTHDLDFSAILAVTHGLKPSVVQIRADNVTFGAIGARVAAALKQMAEPLESGALLTIEIDRHRLRLLPLDTK